MFEIYYDIHSTIKNNVDEQFITSKDNELNIYVPLVVNQFNNVHGFVSSCLSDKQTLRLIFSKRVKIDEDYYAKYVGFISETIIKQFKFITFNWESHINNIVYCSMPCDIAIK